MIKNSKNLIKIILLLIAVLAFGIISTNIASAQYTGTNVVFGDPNYHYNDVNYNNTNNGYNYNAVAYVNPAPVIYSLSPNSITKNSSSVMIAINGSNFVVGSVAKLNGIDQNTIYINSTRLEMNLYNISAMSVGNATVNVYNPNPNGALSNNTTLSIKESPVASTTSSTNNKKVAVAKQSTTTSSTSTTTDTNNVVQETNTKENTNNQGLVAGAIYGTTGGFFPSNLIQWILFIIFILLIVFLWRRLYINNENKHTPLKHA